jgi:hypothetical protein
VGDDDGDGDGDGIWRMKYGKGRGRGGKEEGGRGESNAWNVMDEMR